LGAKSNKQNRSKKDISGNTKDNKFKKQSTLGYGPGKSTNSKVKQPPAGGNKSYAGYQNYSNVDWDEIASQLPTTKNDPAEKQERLKLWN
jgi:hypothetical protein